MVLGLDKDGYGLPPDPDRNVAGVALRALLDALNADFGFSAEITKNIKPGSGIGSSSASSCGAVVAANRLIGDKFSKLELADFAMEGEKLGSGARHADNVAPSIFGGFTLVRSIDPLDIVSIDFPLFAAVIHPQIEIKTADARAILPKDVPLASAIKQWSKLGSLVAGLSKGEIPLIARSMEDSIVEPVRKSLIPSTTQWAVTLLLAEPDHKLWDLAETADIVETRDDALRASFEAAYSELVETLGSDKNQWEWGKLHTAVFGSNPLGQSGMSPIEDIVNRSTAAGGWVGSVNATNWGAGSDYDLTSLPSMRTVYDLSNLDQSVNHHTTGQSGHPYSENYDDQISLWASLTYKPMLSGRAAVEAAAVETLTLEPK